MGYIPEDAKLYLADIVEEITVEGDARKVVHVNMVLIRAESPEEAFEKSVDVGKSGETNFDNPEGKKVTISFKGLHNLNVIYDRLEDGAELTYSEDIGLTDEEINRLIRPKSELGVFAPISRSKGPDYGSKEIIEEVHERFPHLRRTGAIISKDAR